eukprot:1550161-Amphidinium_carterae.1
MLCVAESNGKSSAWNSSCCLNSIWRDGCASVTKSFLVDGVHHASRLVKARHERNESANPGS